MMLGVRIYMSGTWVTLQEGEYNPLVGTGYVLSPCNPQYVQLSDEENAQRLNRLREQLWTPTFKEAFAFGPGHEEPAIFFPSPGGGIGEVSVIRLGIQFDQAAYFALLPLHLGGLTVVIIAND